MLVLQIVSGTISYGARSVVHKKERDMVGFKKAARLIRRKGNR